MENEIAENKNIQEKYDGEDEIEGFLIGRRCRRRRRRAAAAVLLNAERSVKVLIFAVLDCGVCVVPKHAKRGICGGLDECTTC